MGECSEEGGVRGEAVSRVEEGGRFGSGLAAGGEEGRVKALGWGA